MTTMSKLFQRTLASTAVTTASTIFSACLGYLISTWIVALVRLDRYSRESTASRARAMRDADPADG